MRIAVIDPLVSAEYLFEELRKEGVEPIAVYFDGDKSANDKMNSLPKGLGARSLVLSSETRAKLLQTLSDLNVGAVINGCDFEAVQQADLLNKDLGLDFGNFRTSHQLRDDKYHLQDTIAANKLNSIEQTMIHGTSISPEVRAKIQSWGDFFVKPVGSAGTYGSKRCHSIKELEEHLHAYIGSSYSISKPLDKFIVQKMMYGQEYVVDTVSRNGHHKVIGVFQENKALYDDIPIYRHTMTGDPNDPDIKAIIEYAFKVLDLAGYRDGMAHMELFCIDHKPILIELNPRISGGKGAFNLLSTRVFKRTQPQFLAMALKDPQAFEREKEIPNAENILGVVYSVHSFEEGKFLKRFRTESLSKLKTFTGELVIFRENCVVGKPKINHDNIAEITLVGPHDLVLQDVETIKEMEQTRELFEDGDLPHQTPPSLAI